MNTRMSRENGCGGRGLAKGVRLALTVAIAAVAVGCTGIAYAAPAGESPRPSAWAESSADGGPAGYPPTLINDAGTPAEGSSSQLRVGLGLMGLSVLVLAFGIAARPRRPGSSRTVFGAAGSARFGPRVAPTETPKPL